jgi:hypothetical protein
MLRKLSAGGRTPLPQRTEPGGPTPPRSLAPEAPLDRFEAAVRLTPIQREELERDFSSGLAGELLVRAYVPQSKRTPHDLTRVLGERGWRGLEKAHARLQSIPVGALSASLGPKLLAELNATLRDQSGESAPRQRGHFSRPRISSSEGRAAARELGLKPVRLGGERTSFRSPSSAEIAPRLTAAFERIQAALADPQRDLVPAAAELARELVAIRPFDRLNRRTARLLMNRVLAERDLAPVALSAEHEHEVGMSAAAWTGAVVAGARDTLSHLAVRGPEAKDEYLQSLGIFALAHEREAPALLHGRPFALGNDGMLYDLSGRPWLAHGNELIPLSQLEHYFIARRVGALGGFAGTEVLTDLTAETRTLFESMQRGDPCATVSIRSEGAARAADASLELRPSRAIGELLVLLAEELRGSVHAGRRNLDHVFSLREPSGTVASTTMSRYTQVDLELWLLEDGLRSAGHPDLAERVHPLREWLFDSARARLDHRGFTQPYERAMYDASPLRHRTLAEAQRIEGDDQLTVWRGDYAFAGAIGMAPDNDPRKPGAREASRKLAKQGKVRDLYAELMELEHDAAGTPYLCLTSDLALLVGNFADDSNSRSVTLPQAIRGAAERWLAGGKEPGKRIRRDSHGPTLELKHDDGASTVEVTAHRRAFELSIPKRAVLPGIYSQPGSHFTHEQELHGLKRVKPWSIGKVYKADELAREVEVTSEDPIQLIDATQAPHTSVAGSPAASLSDLSHPEGVTS